MATLNGKKALVTGGGRGIGVSIALRLAADGADVALTYSKSASGADTVARKIEALGRRSVAIKADARQAASAKTMIEATIEALGGVDILVFNAGVANVGMLDELSEEQIQEMLDVNVRATVLGVRAALPHLRQGARIVFVGSTLAERVFSGGLAPYAMTKAALAGLARGLARELGPRGINVNIVHPGNTTSDMNPPDHPRVEQMRAMTALGRYNDPEDVAAAILFLCGDDGRQITGASLVVDAGMNA